MLFTLQFIAHVPGSGDFSPHGFCYLWNAQLMWLHIVSDALISLAYFTIPVTLVYIVRKRRVISFGWIFWLFAIFIVACGATHVLQIWNLWHTDYWLEGAVKAVTALASVATALFLMLSTPKLIALPSADELMRATAALESETQERRETETLLRQQEAHYRDLADLLDLTHDAIFVRSLDSRILYWNLGAEKLYGWTKEEAIGQVTHQLLKTVFPEPLESIEAETKTNGSWEGELIHFDRTGERRIVSSRWAARRDASGEPLSILESNRDVTGRIKEEQKFRGLLESAPDPIVIVNSEGIIQLVNARAESVFGYSRAELIGRPIEIVVPERLRAAHDGHRALYSKSPLPRAMGENIELFGRRKDGTEFPVEISLSPLETSEGVLISSAIRDVSDRQRIQQDLRDANEFLEQRVEARTGDLARSNAVLLESQERMSLAQSVAKMGAFSIDGRTQRYSWTSGMDDIYGISRGSFDSRLETWLSFVHPEDRSTALSVMDQSIETRVAHSNEFRIIRADGEVRWIRSRGRLFYNNDGTFARLAGVNIDITEAKDRENEIVALSERLEQRVDERTRELTFANKELESFSYSVSHDLRAPLRHIDGFARILSDEFSTELPVDARTYLDRILKATTDMGRLIEALIKLAHLGRRELVFEKVPLGDLVKQSIADLPHTEADRNVEWHIEPCPTVNCDPDLLKAVLTNLLSNALKFTRTRATTIIEIGTIQKDGATTVFVRDNGVGFDPAYADKLFGVFQRLHAKEKFEGTGIGLATVQRIIHRHGGKIWAESAPEQGATFYFTLGEARSGADMDSSAHDSHEHPELAHLASED